MPSFGLWNAYVIVSCFLLGASIGECIEKLRAFGIPVHLIPTSPGDSEAFHTILKKRQILEQKRIAKTMSRLHFANAGNPPELEGINRPAPPEQAECIDRRHQAGDDRLAREGRDPAGPAVRCLRPVARQDADGHLQAQGVVHGLV